ncbi:MAG TPA: hypothetical protein VFN71_07855 [Methylomirabilota bacterium]|nr:hypothetical protein [Methylomirabilota bacterium]
MRPTWRRKLAAGAVGLYLIGFGIVTGVLIDRARYDARREAVPPRDDESVQQWHAIEAAAEKEAHRAVTSAAELELVP